MPTPSPSATGRPRVSAPGFDIVRPGEIGYLDALARQRRRAERVRKGESPETLFLLTHPPVVTLGRRAKTDENLRHAREDYETLGIEVVETDRGGDVTFHGPGQVVGYPILDLRYRGLGPHTYLRFLEDVLIGVLGKFGIEAFRDADHTGVWTEVGKIAAMGIRVSAGVTLHGFALNVNTDLRYFDMIVPCGISGRSVASMQGLLGRELDLEFVMDRIGSAFRAASPGEQAK